MRSSFSNFRKSEITLFITSEQLESRFTIKTKITGLENFTKTESGIYTRTGVARSETFTSILLQTSGDFNSSSSDVSVRSNGNDDLTDRNKGFIIEAENPTHELTVYALNNDKGSIGDAFMGISCQEFPEANEYSYFIFSAPGSRFSIDHKSQFLITPCEDDTAITVTPSQVQVHPVWVQTTVSVTDPSVSRSSEYRRLFNTFETLMLSNFDDLTGTVITSSKPLSVFTGHQCGQIFPDGFCGHLVEQIPPHATYGDRFLLAPFDLRESGEVYRIGALNINTRIDLVNCSCAAKTASGNRVGLTVMSLIQMAFLNRGEYVECQTPSNRRTFCSVESTKPVTVMSYTLSLFTDKIIEASSAPDFPVRAISDPLLVYIPPRTSYLSQYSVTSLTQGPLYFSYVAESVQQSFPSVTVDNEYFNSTNDTTIDCIMCVDSTVTCGRGGVGSLGNGEFSITGSSSFWGFVYGFDLEISYALPLPFKQLSTGRELHYTTKIMVKLI